MKSRITIRDDLVQSFLQSLQHTSRWARLIYLGHYNTADGSSGTDMQTIHRWHIQTIKPKELKAEIKLMEAILENVNVKA